MPHYARCTPSPALHSMPCRSLKIIMAEYTVLTTLLGWHTHTHTHSLSSIYLSLTHTHTHTHTHKHTNMQKVDYTTFSLTDMCLSQVISFPLVFQGLREEVHS